MSHELRPFASPLHTSPAPRATARAVPLWQGAWRAVATTLRLEGGAGLPSAVAAALAESSQRWQNLDHTALAAAAQAWRESGASAGRAGSAGQAARPGNAGQAARCGEALALAAVALRLVLGLVPYDKQFCAAWLMMDGALVEMATGEGKTVAAALAAAATALQGTPVHVLTANDYLVQRDRDTMAPVFELIGLRSAAVTAPMGREARRAAYRHDIVYATGREVVFDYLKDHVALGGERDARLLRARGLTRPAAALGPVLPDLCQAFIDEADSILLDEACIPFVLAAPGSAPVLPALHAARALAATLGEADIQPLPARRDVQFTPAGLARMAQAVHSASPLWPLRQAHELVRAALVADRLLQRDRDYAVLDDGIALIDEITGRIAAGRQWTGALHAMVELKEGRTPGPCSTTAARITFQRFFPRYPRLGGMSGTLRESRGELRALYGCKVIALPLHRPSQARWLGTRCFVDSSARWAAVAERVAELRAAGRPVLVGTDSVAASRALSLVLGLRGIEHELLNAVQDAGEADLVARAGEAGRVTVATNIAGRGTDIRLDAAARQAGGLHVILALANRSRRIDRQLRGRGARHGDPGSAERLLALDDAMLSTGPGALLRSLADGGVGVGAGAQVPPLAARLALGLAQRGAEWRARLLRRDLRLADDGLSDTYRIAGSTE